MEMISWVGFVNKIYLQIFAYGNASIRLSKCREPDTSLGSFTLSYEFSIPALNEYEMQVKKILIHVVQMFICVKWHAFLVALRYEVSCCVFFLNGHLLFYSFDIWRALLFAPDNIWHYIL